MLDLYAAIGASATGSADDLRKAYRATAFEHHPDRRPGDPVALQRFKDAGTAWAVLSNEGLRAAYDRRLAGGDRASVATRAPAPPWGSTSAHDWTASGWSRPSTTYNPAPFTGWTQRPGAGGPALSDDQVLEMLLTILVRSPETVVAIGIVEAAAKLFRDAGWEAVVKDKNDESGKIVVRPAPGVPYVNGSPYLSPDDAAAGSFEHVGRVAVEMKAKLEEGIRLFLCPIGLVDAVARGLDEAAGWKVEIKNRTDESAQIVVHDMDDQED
jgi:DnaJ domain